LTATLISVEEEQDLYKIKLAVSGQNYDSYATKDGRLFFVSGIDMTVVRNTTTTTVPQATKTAKPEVNLFVMGFCPYGVQAEQAMKPVVDLLGNKTNLNVRFIVSVQGDTIDSVSSLHGAKEAKEDARQVCIMKYYDQKTYWNYLMEIDTNCYPNSGDATALDACWKQAAQKFGINATKIETCAYGTEGISLLKADEQLAGQYSVTGSPTLIINGQVYSGARTPDAFKQGICSAFITAPSECSNTLSTSGGTTSGGCG
jgi:predicted DsbA family dithiol-disulfide isomerase